MIEPLADQATPRGRGDDGAGGRINFSLRSVALAGEIMRSAMRWSKPLRADEILQMFGRAGRRGLDETGFVHDHGKRDWLLEAQACHLSRKRARWIERVAGPHRLRRSREDPVR